MSSNKPGLVSRVGLTMFVVSFLLISDEGISSSTNHFLDSSNYATLQLHLDAVRMGRRGGQDSADNAVCQLASRLVSLFNDSDFTSYLYVAPISAVGHTQFLSLVDQ